MPPDLPRSRKTVSTSSWSAPDQARIHTGFTALRKSVRFFIINIFLVKKLWIFQVEIWKMIWTVRKYPVWMTQRPRKGDFAELKYTKFPEDPCPQTSLAVGNRSILILDPRLISIHFAIGSFLLGYSMLPSIRTVPVSGHLKHKLNFWGALFSSR